MSSKTYRESLYNAMAEAMADHDNTMILGQGVTDFKGTFGTTIDLHKKYKTRVIETPIAEDSIAGVCIGASLNGMYPINTHIRADFGLLAFNQIVNLAAKYKYMFGGLFEIPMMIRLVIGRSWGQGAQHSQSLQSLLAHIPGLTVLMPSNPFTITRDYRHAISKFKGPVIFLEHRLLYEISFEQKSFSIGKKPFETDILSKGKDITIISTSIMTLECTRAVSFLKTQGISVDLIDLNSISHPNYEIILDSIKKTGRLLVVDTSWKEYGVCAEINRIINEKNSNYLKVPSRSLGMKKASCPTAKSLEDIFYPDVHDIVKECFLLLGKQLEKVSNIPKKQPMTDYYKHFKGPF